MENYVPKEYLILFDSEAEFKMELRFYVIDKDEIKVIAEHERAHVEAARSLGYGAKYGIKHNMYWYQPITHIPTEVPKSDLIKIILAPKELSLEDIKQLKKLEWNFKT